MVPLVLTGGRVASKMRRVGVKLTVQLLVFLMVFGPTSSVSAAEGDGTSKNVSTAAQGIQMARSNASIGARNDEFTGAFLYGYTFALPPGRNNLTPSLKLAYNSGRLENDSYVGYGWSFDIPSITRVNKHGSDHLYEYDDFTSALSGDLVKVSTTTYRSEVETGAFLSYTFENNSWTVYDESGTRYRFGSSTDARQNNATTTSEVYQWMLEEVRDTNDNYIKYEYHKNAGQIYPSVITYTGNGVTDGVFEIIFNRMSNDTSPTMYHAGFPVKSNYRITSIDVEEDDEWVRKYDLSYITGDAGYRSLLSSVVETGRDLVSSATSSKTTSFSYQDRGPLTWTLAATSTWELPVQLYDEQSGSPSLIQLRDVNGDAYPDVVQSAEGEGAPSCSNNEKKVYINDTQGGWDEYDCLSGGWTPPLFIKHANHTHLDHGTRIFDYNGDFLDDFVWSYTSTTGDGVTSWDVYRNTGLVSSTWATTSVSVPIGFVFGDTISADNGIQISDVNGDGLADIVFGWLDDDAAPYTLLENTYLGNGAGWTAATSTNWSLPWGIIDENPGGTEVFTFAQFMDINGDGLTDYLFEHADGDTGEKTGINNGYTWLLNPNGVGKIPIPTQGDTYTGRTDLGVRSWDVNGDGISDFISAITEGSSVDSDLYLGTLDEDAPFTSIVSLTIPLGFALSNQESQMTGIADVNADGMIDLLRAVNNASGTSMDTYLSDGAPFTDMLVGITTSEGASSTIAYKLSTQYFDGSDNLLNPDLPLAVPTLQSITTNDGIGNLFTEEYTYADGTYYYNEPFDRKFAGFGLTTKTDDDGNVTKTYFHQGNASASSTGEYQDHISKRGKPYRIEEYDDDENLYAKTINKWDRYDRGSGASFIELIDTVNFIYDGDSDRKDKAERYTYNTSTGHVTEKIEWGVVTGNNDGTLSDTGSDKFTTTFLYASSTATSTPNFYKVSQETKLDQSAVKVSERKIYYDTLGLGSLNDGNPTKEELWRVSSAYIDVEKTYNGYGLVTQIKDPRDKTTNYSYDAFNLYLASSSDPVGNVRLYEYDYSSGKVSETTDPNGRVFQTLYDPFDRVREEKQPDIASPSSLVTKTLYQYNDATNPDKVQVTRYLGSSTSSDSYIYLDGFGRKIQERIETESSSTWATKDYRYNNADGLVTSESLPYFSVGTTFTGTSSVPVDSLQTRYTYDPLGKVLTVANNVGTSTYSHDDWVTTVTDPNGETKDLTSDAYGNLTQVVEHNGASSYTTAYEYDGNKKLTKITDADGNVRNFTYDGLGRRLTAQDVHDSGDGTFGSWTYAYDDAGNMASSTDPKSQVISFTYDDINRVTAEDYTGSGGTEMAYAYDTCTEGEGHLCTATSTNAISTYTYNALGLVATETKNVSSTNYTTTYSYDRQGNITGIVYPDSSEAAYVYNTAGLLESIKQKESGGSFAEVVMDLNYGPTGAVTYKQLANGVESSYTYDENELYRLTNISTAFVGGIGGGDLVDIGYWDGDHIEYFNREDTENNPYHLFALADADEFNTGETSPEPSAGSVEPFESLPPETPDSLPEGSVLGESAPVPEPETEVPVLPPEPESIPAEEPVEPSPVESGEAQGAQSEEPALTQPSLQETPSEEILMPLLHPPTGFLISEPLGRAASKEDRRMKTEVVSATDWGTPLHQARIYADDIQYIDPATNELADIDITLIDKGDAWTMAKAPYAARLAKSAQEKVITFRVGSTELYLSPYASTPATATKESAGENRGEVVRYPNALGTDVDMEVMLDNTTLRKEAVLENSNAMKSLTSVDGYVEVPFLLESNEKINLSVDGKDLGESGSFTTGDTVEIAGLSGDTAYFLPPVAIDAEGNTVSIEIRYAQTEQGIAFTKLLPLAWLEGATYPVRTDVTVSYYATGGTGDVYKDASSNWNTVHDATTGSESGVGGQEAGTETRTYSGSNYRIRRMVLPFDTSALPDNTFVESATLNVFVTTRNDEDDDGNDFIRMIQATTDTAATNEVYDQIGAIDNPTAGAADIDLENFSQNSWEVFTFNATGRSWVNNSTSTLLGLREGHDVVDDPIGAGKRNSITIFTPYREGTTYDPYITMTYHINAAPSAPTGLLTEGRTNPMDITDGTPEFSAIYQDSDATSTAASYQIQVATSTAMTNPYWDSTKTALSASTTPGNRIPDISYAGSALVSSTPYYWRIKLWDNDNVEGAWSATSTFQIAVGFPVDADIIQDISFSYDDVGNITEIDDDSATGLAKTTAYTYDDLHRLTSASTTVASNTPYRQSYTYSPIGNITGFATTTGATSTYTYAETSSTNPHAVTSIGSSTLVYDTNGNLTSYGSSTYAWDFMNRLTSMSTGSATTTYQYDHTMQRVKKTVGATSTIFANNFYNTDGSKKTKHVYAGNELIATIETIGATSTTQYIHVDHLGGTNAVTDEAGDVVEITDYYPYGGQRAHEGTFTEQRKFTGHEYDSEVDLTYANARYYDQDMGRWTAQDPASRDNPDQFLSDPQQLNYYSYARNNPINGIDPTGQYWLFAKTRASGDIMWNADNIKNAAQLYPDVRADILGASIYEERRGARNINPADIFDVPAGLVGADMSIGLGQIRISTAQKVANAGYFSIDDLYKENFKFSNFLPDRLKLIRLLSNSQTNAVIGAAFLQSMIDQWKDVIPDVANNAELLGSLYNYSEAEPSKEGYSNSFGERVAGSVPKVQELLKDKEE